MPQATYLEAIRQGLWRVVFLLLFAAGSNLHAQKIGEVDLTREPPAAQEQVLPECEGVPVHVDHTDADMVRHGARRKLELRLISLSSVKPPLGSAVEAEATFKNIGSNDIVIPWSTDPNTASRPPRGHPS